MIDGFLTIDDHTHIGAMKSPRLGIGEYTAQDLVRRMDYSGIDVSVVCHLISPLWTAEEIAAGNELVRRAVGEYRERLAGLVVVNPKFGAMAVEEARRGLDLGMKGIKVHPIMHGFYPIAGEVMDPLMELAGEYDVPVVTHSDYNARCCTPYEVARLAARYPKVTVVMLHLGLDAEATSHTPDVAAPHANLMLDTSQTVDSPYAVFVGPARKVGADRLMLGGDGPIISVEANLAKLQTAERLWGLTREEKRLILGENAKRVFKL